MRGGGAIGIAESSPAKALNLKLMRGISLSTINKLLLIIPVTSIFQLGILILYTPRSNVTIILSALSLITLIIASSIYILLKYRFLFPLSKIKRFLEEGESDKLKTEKKLAIESDDEIGALAILINNYLDELHRIIENVQSDNEGFFQVIYELENTIKDQAQVSLNQPPFFNQASSLLEKVSSTLAKIANTYSEVKDSTERTLKGTEMGQGLIEDTVEEIKVIDKKMKKSVAKVRLLNEKAEHIENIIKTIDSIIDQTKIVSFNASIEAAGAGEMGKRFAIVAGELNKLAENIILFTAQVKEIISTIQLTTNEIISSFDENIKKTSEGFMLAEKLGRIFEEVTNLVKGNNRSTIKIKETIDQCSQEGINQTVSLIKTGFDQTASKDNQKILVLIDRLKKESRPKGHI